MTPTITCFGEVLWDVLPTTKQAGGAPMNVAFQLRNLGVNSQLISRVGDDELGKELLEFLQEKGIPTEYVQVGQTHLTGVAKANISDSSEVTYKIVQPVAWDYMQLEPGAVELVRQSALFVYGSLAARSPQTHETLRSLLAVAKRKVFDVNMRPPHYERETVEELLHEANIAKLNEHELAELSGWYEPASDAGSDDAESDATAGTDFTSENLQPTMQQLRDRYNLEILCVTLGADGAALLDGTGFYQQAGFPVQVADTIGSGDAFLAAFLTKTLQGETPQKTLEFACATGAYLATQRGATPTFSAETIQNQMLQPPVT